MWLYIHSRFVTRGHMKSSQSFSMIPCIFMVSWKVMKPQSSVLTYSGYFFVLSSSPQCRIISRKIVTLIRWKLTKLKFMQGTSCDVGACYGALSFSIFIWWLFSFFERFFHIRYRIVEGARMVWKTKLISEARFFSWRPPELHGNETKFFQF